MASSDKMEKYLNKKAKYTAVDTIDKVFKKAVDKSDKEQAVNKKKMDKLLIRDDDIGREILMKESEDGVMTYFTGQGNYHQAIRYGKRPRISARARRHNLQFSKEILAAEGVLTPDMEDTINDALKGI